MGKQEQLRQFFRWIVDVIRVRMAVRRLAGVSVALNSTTLTERASKKLATGAVNVR